MVETANSEYTIPEKAHYRETRMDEATFSMLQDCPPERRDMLLDRYLLAKSILNMTAVPYIVSEFVKSSLLFSEEEGDIPLDATHYFFGNKVGDQERETLHVMNTVEVSFYDEDSDNSYRIGVGIVDLDRIGGFFYSQQGETEPEDDKAILGVLDYGTKLTPILNNVYVPEQTKFQEIEQYAEMSLDDAYNRYWQEITRYRGDDERKFFS